MSEPQRIDPAIGLSPAVRRRLASITPIEVEREEVETPEEAAERRAKALQNRLRLYRPPSRFARASIADLDPEQQDPGRKVSRWLGEGGKTLLILSGIKGNGKSHAAYAIGNEAVRSPGVPTAAWSMVDLNDALRPGHDENAYYVACSIDLLILDDLGAEKMSDWTLERLGGLVDARWREEHLRTVVTSNLVGLELVERYGERVCDRLADDAWTAVFTGRSQRTKRADPFAD